MRLSDRFAAAGVLATDWSDAGLVAPLGATTDDLYADLDSDRRLRPHEADQAALATVGSLVQRSIRDFVA